MTKVVFPARCAVAVVCGDQLVSQVYPAAVPIEVFLDDIVALLDADLKRRGQPGLESAAGYELHKANGVRLDVGKALDELGVEDGSTLVLAPAADGESFEPQCESLSTGLARAGRRLSEPVTAATAAHTALGVVTMTVIAALGLALRARTAADSPEPATVAATAGLLAAGAAAAVRRWWPQRSDLLTWFGWLAVPPIAMALASAAPGNLGAAHVVIAALAAALMVCGIVTATGRSVVAAGAVVTLCTLGGAVAAVRMWQPLPAAWLGMGVLIALLLLLTLAPTIALWCARIRPPHFGSITGRDLFRRGAQMPADAVAPVDLETETCWGESEADTTPRGPQIAAAAGRATGVLTGICVGAALALPAAVWPTLTPGRDHSAAAALLVALLVVIYISRGRAHADRCQAVALVCGAGAAVCAGIVRYVLHEPAGGPSMLAGALALAGFGGAALAAGLLTPAARFTPLVRMCVEWLELAAIVAALPLAAWLGGVFSWVRAR